MSIKILLVLTVSVSCLLMFLAIRNIKEAVPEDDRSYMDPLPPMLRLAWPLVRLFAFYVGERLPTDWLERYQNTIRRSGVAYLMSADEFVGLKCLGAAAATAIAGLILSTLEALDPLYLGLAGVVGWVLPSLSLRDLRKKREKEILRALPTYLDFLTMAVQAGMNLSGALQQAVEKGPEGPLRGELNKVVRDVRAGMSRIDALKAMAERLDIREVNTFVTAVAQSDKTGASIGDTLKVQADQRRTERFQRAEKLAMEAPVKLIFPLVVFIFPMTFLVLGFPIAMKFMYEL
ncbi:type II secretion system F family protein [Marinobacter salicampi]|uniref:type II secretion system F family protein n=1 Tax=Marinobacter salicampi TaxID=435907 RepID=UPI001A9455AB|nr:type II secretion system F family protein [Marinobacter salicampi]